MTVEQMCCTPAQAKLLKNLGIEQKSYFYHATEGHILHLEYLPMTLKDRTDIIGSAYNVAELGIMLPEYITVKRGKYSFEHRRQQWFNPKGDFSNTEEFRIAYRYNNDINGEICDNFHEPMEAIIRARALIYLLEKKFTTCEKVNERIKA